jgi:hypothetical protein
MRRVVPRLLALLFGSIPAICFVIVVVLKKKLPFPEEPVLGLAELAGWFWHGDEGHLHLLYATGLPIAIVVYATAWAVGSIALEVFLGPTPPNPDPGREAGG